MVGAAPGRAARWSARPQKPPSTRSTSPRVSGAGPEPGQQIGGGASEHQRHVDPAREGDVGAQPAARVADPELIARRDRETPRSSAPAGPEPSAHRRAGQRDHGRAVEAQSRPGERRLQRRRRRRRCRRAGWPAPAPAGRRRPSAAPRCAPSPGARDPGSSSAPPARDLNARHLRPARIARASPARAAPAAPAPRRTARPRCAPADSSHPASCADRSRSTPPPPPPTRRHLRPRRPQPRQLQQTRSLAPGLGYEIRKAGREPHERHGVLRPAVQLHHRLRAEPSCCRDRLRSAPSYVTGITTHGGGSLPIALSPI